MYRFSFTLCAAFLLSMFCVHESCDAVYTFTPIVQEFAPSGTDSTKTFQVKNPSTEPVALQFVIAERTADEKGNEILDIDVAEDLFLIYPAQVVLMPEQQQVVRVSWLGENTVQKELAFRLMSKQLPIDLRTKQEREAEKGNVDKHQIRLLYNYSAALYVVPEGAQPNIVLESVREVNDEDGTKWVEASFYNKGLKHQVLKDLTLSIVSNETGEASFSFEKEMFVGGLNVLAGHKKMYRLPWPKDLSALAGDFEFDYLGKEE